ncbi:MAG TPA: PglZ domain-containing protein [Solirubrobacteraceae bacterium]|jgi:hypothetical protein|nr:PglZ domain-containing protein [Solirubrobacteraceae bacterium]
MNPFHAYLCGQLEPLLTKRRIVVFYDPRSEFVPFFDGELQELGAGPDGLVKVAIGERETLLARYTGAFFGLRAAVEPVVAKDGPDFLIVYLPGVERDRDASVLMEIEKGGTCYAPQLKRLARTVLRQFQTDGAIDEMLAPAGLTYDDIVHYLEESADGQQGSVLRAIFAGAASEGLLMQWLASDEHDADIGGKGAADELYRLLESRLGLSLPSGTPVGDARVKAARYVLVNEFRGDLEGEAPTSLSMVPRCSSTDHEGRIRDVCSSLRRQHADQYAALADRVEQDLNLDASDIDPNRLGTTDTFRFEEARLLARAIELTAAQEYDAALELALERAHSFWLDRDLARQAQWGACRLAAELGRETTRVRQAVRGPTRSSTAWVKAYSTEGGWFEADRLQRRLETWIAQMDDDPEADRAAAVARKEHDDTLKHMAEGFSSAFADAGWTVPDVLSQTQIYPDVVQAGGLRVAYFLVDAMRFEMGVELGDQLQGVEELTVRPALAALPTITPVGMAALLPGASASFSVIAGNGKLAARVDDSVMADLVARLKFFKLAVPDLVELTLDKLLHTRESKLATMIGAAPLILIRSQDIDLAGEMADSVARHVMDTTIGNIARAVRKLAAAGVESFVITADHGHQFTSRKDEDMRTDSPGGDTVELHRRCWAGRGGTTPPGTVRVSGAELGYDTDLDFIFPTGLGVFKAGGGLSYHHGGISLQEMVIPVLSFRVATRRETKPLGRRVDLTDVPQQLTNRTFGVRLSVVGDVLTTEPISLRVVLIAGDQQVGQAGMAVGADLDSSSGVLTIATGAEASLGIMLTVDDCETVRLVVQDPATDAVLAQSDLIPIKLGI